MSHLPGSPQRSSRYGSRRFSRRKREQVQTYLLIALIAVAVIVALVSRLFTQPSVWVVGLSALVVMNLIDAMMFAVDKFLARVQSSFRIPELVFIFMAFIGGAPGILLTAYLVRHKTNKIRKPMFLNIIWIGLVVDVVGVAGIIVLVNL